MLYDLYMLYLLAAMGTNVYSIFYFEIFCLLPKVWSKKRKEKKLSFDLFCFNYPSLFFPLVSFTTNYVKVFFPILLACIDLSCQHNLLEIFAVGF